MMPICERSKLRISFRLIPVSPRNPFYVHRTKRQILLRLALEAGTTFVHVFHETFFAVLQNCRTDKIIPVAQTNLAYGDKPTTSVVKGDTVVTQRAEALVARHVDNTPVTESVENPLLAGAACHRTTNSRNKGRGLHSVIIFDSRRNLTNQERLYKFVLYKKIEENGLQRKQIHRHAIYGKQAR